MRENKGAILYSEAKKIIPGGTQLLSKRPEMFLPGQWPAYYSKCKGVNVWDISGNKYIDMSIAGVGACSLGYGDPDVDAAVLQAAKAGNMCTLNAPEEFELAKLLCAIHPWAESVRYARCGGEAMAVAVRIVRAYSGKEKILFCGYHGWHDWYLSANLAEYSALDGQLLPGLNPLGVPRGLKDTSIPFLYNDLKGFKLLTKKYQGDIAGVIMEPVRNFWPNDDFIKGIRQITKKERIPLVFDEITSGFRMVTGGIHIKLGVNPDLAVFAKALGNGYPMAAIIGIGKVMNVAQKTFISSTYWTDRIGPSAAIATLNKHMKNNVSAHLVLMGEMVQKGWKGLVDKYKLDIQIHGIPPLSHWQINGEDRQLAHTAIVKKMLEKGFLTSQSFYATYAHNALHIEKYLSALDETLEELIPYIKSRTLRKIYKGSVAHSGFKRLA